MSVQVSNESGAEVDELTLVALCRHLLDQLGIDPLAELSLILVDVPAMTALHEQWMDEPGPTDVLAFPMDELTENGGHQHPGDGLPGGPAMLGDVVLCPDVAAAQAKAAGHSTEDELHLLCTHGVLHLLGYDHGEPDEHTAMFARQSQLLTSWRAVRASGSRGSSES